MKVVKPAQAPSHGSSDPSQGPAGARAPQDPGRTACLPVVTRTWSHMCAFTNAHLCCATYSCLFSLPLLLAASSVQAGLIRTDVTDYFIEPLERGQQDKEASGRTHVVYRREVVRQEWAEPRGDLHNEGKLWAGPPALPLPTPSQSLQVTSGLKPLNAWP